MGWIGTRQKHAPDFMLLDKIENALFR